jgi:hypothetical protein
MFGYYKKTYIKRNIYILLVGIPKNKNKTKTNYIEMIETLYF